MPDNQSITAWKNFLSHHGASRDPWARLDDFFRTLDEPDCQAFVELVKGLPPKAPAMAFFRALFLVNKTGSLQWLEQAGAALDAWPDAPYLQKLTFVYYVWGYGFSQITDARSFRVLFETAGIPLLLRNEGVRLGLQWGAPACAPAGPDQPLRRVAIVTPALRDFGDAPTRLTLEHAALMASLNLKVKIFSSMDQSGLDAANTLGIQWNMPRYKMDTDSWKPQGASGTFEVEYSSELLPHEIRWQLLADNIAGYAPDLVLFVGFFSPMLEWLYQHFPVVAISIHAQAPIGNVDLWLHQFDQAQEVPVPWPGQQHFALQPYLYRAVLPEVPAVSLAPLQLADNALVVISAGFRISQEMPDAWVVQVLRYLDEHPQWVWLIAGEDQLPASVPAGHDRIRVLPAQQNFTGLLKSCALYLNPPRIGGGVSVLHAMGVGLPVLSLADSDGGNKLGAQAAANLDDYWHQLKTLLSEASTRDSLGKALKERFFRLYDLRQAGPDLITALEEARRHFWQRNGNML